MTTEEFKTGEYVVYLNGTYRIENDGKHYILFSVNENTSTPVVHVQYGSWRLRLWTVRDAKDGDALVYGHDKRPFIFKGLLDKFHPECPVAYCGIDDDGTFVINTGDVWWTDKEVQPATKEQRDLLFQNMKEAGYEWDPHTKKIIEVTMTTIDYKEKYMQALERARQFSEKPYLEDSAGIVEYIFPELSESKDERIRKKIIDLIKEVSEDDSYHVYRFDEMIAWLEKQEIKEHDVCDTCDEKAACVNPCPVKLVEHKPIDKVEPKFKVGDKIKLAKEPKYPAREIIAIKNDAYYFDKLVHLPLRGQDNWELVEQKPAWSEEDEKMLDDIHEFFDKHKINPLKHDMDDYAKFIKSLKDRVQPQPIQDWSEEDEHRINDTIYFLETAKKHYASTVELDACIDWLKSLKDRVQPKQEWSKEDRRHIEKLILNVNAKEFPDEVDWLISLHEKIAPPYWDKEDEEMLNQAIQEVEYALNDKNIAFSGREPVLLWLKHLRPKSQWKPSDMELEVLRLAAEKDGTCLMGLYEQSSALIEKACEYLMEYEFNDSPTIADRRKRVEDFKKYIRGE